MIEEFEALVIDHQLPRETLQKVEERLSNGGKRSFSLTALQKEVLADPRFWNDTMHSNIVIQGATSSGKTLLSEIAAISCLSRNQRQQGQVIILVPLKAMVYERWNVFSDDLDEKRVFAASADYQDHDSDLVQGDYDVAIIVYEKFFALIAQYGSRLLDKCGLLIADEIQMLSTNGRGPKLEFSLQRVLEWHQNIRIMGLTTNHSKVDVLKKWMNVDFVLGNPTRPIGLEEYVISIDGKTWKHVEHGETSSDFLEAQNDENNPIKGFIPLDTKLSEQAPLSEQKNNLLISLLRDILHNDNEKGKESKIIIFSNSRNKTRALARLLSQSGLYKRQNLSSQVFAKVANTDSDEFQSELLGNLLPYGIAFHNSALPVSLRQIIENDFSDPQGTIKIIVATETLTIGMNMPTDIMVLYDKTVYRGDHSEHELLPQEYKNFIGRAGRLGFDKTYGRSYLIVSPKEVRNCWHYYVFPEQTEIISSLPDYNATNSNNEEVAIQHAPYYLNIMTNLHFGIAGLNMVLVDRLAEVEAHSLGNCNNENNNNRSTTRIQEMLRWLERAKLLKQTEDPFTGRKTAELNKFGECMSPYALSCHTCFEIYTYIVHDGIDGSPGNGGMPYDVTAKDIQNDKYLLDILFRICLSSEINESANLNAPEDKLNGADRFTDTIKALLTYLKKYKKESGIWKDSPLEEYFKGDDTPTIAQINALMRAVILLHWTKGQTVKEIVKETGLSGVAIITGDVERLAEVCSYQIEAISKVINVAKQRLGAKLSNEFYYLSTRVKYGMNRELVPIANRHIVMLDRMTILRIGQLAKKHQDIYENAVVFLKEATEKELEEVVTQELREQIVSKIDQRYLQNSFTNLIERLYEDQILEQEQRDIFLCLYQAEEWFENQATYESYFETIINDIVKIRFVKDASIDSSCYLLQFAPGQSLMVCITNGDKASTSKLNSIIARYQNDDSIIKRIIVGKHTVNIPTGERSLVLSLSNFCGIIAQYLAETSGTISGRRRITWGHELMNLLNDQYGTLGGYDGKALQPLMMNYISRKPKDSFEGSADIVFVHDQTFPYSKYISEVLTGLKNHDKKVQFYTWGQNDQLEQFSGLVVFLLSGRYINSSSYVLELSRKYSRNSYALWYFDEDKSASSTVGFAIPGSVSCNAEESVKLILEQFVTLQAGNRRKYAVGISYKHHDDDFRVAKLAKKLATRYGQDRVLFDKFQPELFSTQGAGGEIEMLFRQECCFAIVGITNDYDGQGWHRNEYRGIRGIRENPEKRVGYLMLERLKDPKSFKYVDTRQDGTVELYEDKEADLEQAFLIFRKNIDAAIEEFAVRCNN